jgi:hypothetical protein
VASPKHSFPILWTANSAAGITMTEHHRYKNGPLSLSLGTSSKNEEVKNKEKPQGKEQIP